MNQVNSFLTLTFAEEHLPADGSVRVRDLQLFFKRLRIDLVREAERAQKNQIPRIRYYACGEYGEKFKRPHYHVILFNYDFPDKIFWRRSHKGYCLYRSAQLEKLWPFGHCEIGTVSSSSGGYVARYCLKKINGEESLDYYTRVDPETGEWWVVRQEFALSSGGLGKSWYEQFKGDCFPSDFIILDGQKVPIPKYFVKLFRLEDPEGYEILIRKRKAFQAAQAENNTSARLRVREESQKLRAEKLKREYEEGPIQ